MYLLPPQFKTESVFESSGIPQVFKDMTLISMPLGKSTRQHIPLSPKIFNSFFFKLMIHNLKNFLLFFSFYGCTWDTLSSQAGGQIRVAAASLHHSHCNTGSKPHLWPMPQLAAMPDPRPTEQGQGSNMHPHKHYVGFLSPWATIRTPKMFNSWDSIRLTVCTGICSWIQQPASHCWQILHWNVTDLSIYLVKCELISH